MRVAINASTSSSDELSVGNLVLFGRNQQQLGVVLRAGTEDKNALFGVFNPDDEPHPRIQYVHGQCLNLGKDWILEPVIDADVFPGNASMSHRAGWLCLAPTGWMMSLASSSIDFAGRFNVEWWKIGAEGEMARNIEIQSVGFAKWRIWADEESRLSLRGTPLFEHEAKAPTPR